MAKKSRLEQDLEAAQAENKSLKKERPITLKVSQKGGVSLYGLGRFPVTLYREQWLRVCDMADEIREFIAASAGKLKSRP